METLNAVINQVNTVLWSYILIVLLIGLGLYFTIRTGFVQIRYLGEMFRVLVEGVGNRGTGQISSFQAFCVSTASRVGVGNIAGVAIAICIASFATRGLSFGIDFTGGRTYVVRFDQPVNAVDVRSDLAKQFDEAPEVKTYGPSNQLKITTKYKIAEDGDAVKNEIVEKLFAGTGKYFKAPITVNDFKSTETSQYGIIQADQVGGTIAHDNLMHSIWAVIGGLLVMFVYIGLRFRSWRFGVGSVTALAHDTILVIGIFSLLYGLLPFNLEVDQYFISAVLTVIGYSINATVVIFDRVREYRKLYPKRDLRTHMNDAINSTLARTVNTSGTTFVTLLMMFIFGGEVIRGFIFALLVGVLVGVFSSLCIACSVVYEISGKQKTPETKELA